MVKDKKYVNPPVDEIDGILDNNRVIAVVGLSSKPDRPSYLVASYLKRKGYRVIPVNPKETEILGEKAYSYLGEIPHKVDIVNIFRKSECVSPIVEDAVKIGAKVLWMQEGVVNHEAAFRASRSGMMVLMDKCIAAELRRHLSI